MKKFCAFGLLDIQAFDIRVGVKATLAILPLLTSLSLAADPPVMGWQEKAEKMKSGEMDLDGNWIKKPVPEDPITSEAKRQVARVAMESAQSKSQDHGSYFEACEARVRTKHPQFADPNSELSKLIEAKKERRAKAGIPFTGDDLIYAADVLAEQLPKSEVPDIEPPKNESKPELIQTEERIVQIMPPFNIQPAAEDDDEANQDAEEQLAIAREMQAEAAEARLETARLADEAARQADEAAEQRAEMERQQEWAEMEYARQMEEIEAMEREVERQERELQRLRQERFQREVQRERREAQRFLHRR